MKQVLVIIFLALLPAFSFAQNATSPDKAKTIAAGLDKKDKLQKTNNNNNNTRSSKGQCCKNGVMPQAQVTYVTLNTASKWEIENKTKNTFVACPNPIVSLGNKKAEWSVFLHDGAGLFLQNKLANIANGEFIMSTQGLTNGKYIIEVDDSGVSYVTSFRVGADPNAMKEVKPQVKKKGN
jgi:hypothetical protein